MNSPLITILRSNEPINHIEDPRIIKLQEILLYFTNWGQFCLERKDPSSKIGNFMIHQSFADLISARSESPMAKQYPHNW